MESENSKETKLTDVNINTVEKIEPEKPSEPEKQVDSTGPEKEKDEADKTEESNAVDQNDRTVEEKVQEVNKQETNSVEEDGKVEEKLQDDKKQETNNVEEDGKVNEKEKDINNIEENGKVKEGPSSTASSKAEEFCRQHWLLLFVIFLILFTVIVIIILLVFLIAYLDGVKAGPKLGFRLPKNVIPYHYFLEIEPNFEKSKFYGTETISFTSINATDKIILHSLDLTIDKDSVSISGGDDLDLIVVNVKYDYENQFVIFSLCHQLRVGKVYDISFSYEGDLNVVPFGFFRLNYEDNLVKKSLALTKFETNGARAAFSCFDEPAFKAKFTISIVRGRNMKSISNMPLSKTLRRDDDLEIDVFEESVPMSTYLVAFVVGELESIGRRPLLFHAVKNISSYEYALNVSYPLLHYFEKFLSTRYTLPKLDQFASPGYPTNGMENYGLIIYWDIMLKKPFTSENEITRLVSHEIVHQWFGNLVTPKWWDEFWLNEAFAAYFGYMGANHIYPEWRMGEEFVPYSHVNMHMCSLLDVVKPIVNSNENISLSISMYRKGGAMIRMLHLILGDYTFRKGLESYLNANMQGNVDQDELWRHLTQAQSGRAHLNIKQIMDPWITQPAYPILTVTRDYRRNEARITQAGCSDTIGENLWHIPVTVIDGRNPEVNTTVKIWLSTKQGTLDNLPGKNIWILVNVQMLGYYKVNYDDTNWRLLLWQLRHDFLKIPPLNRRDLIETSLEFASEGLLSHKMALDIFSYYPFEKDIIVLSSLRRINFHLRTYYLITRDTHVQGQWKDFMIYVFGPIYERYTRNWDLEIKFDGGMSEFRKNLIVHCCDNDYGPCIREARKKYKPWLDGNTFSESKIHPQILCSVIRTSGKTEWRNIYRAMNEQNVRQQILELLGCTKDTENLIWFVENVWNPEMKLQFMTADLCWYILDHLEFQWSKLSSERKEQALINLAKHPRSVKIIKMLEDFYLINKETLSESQRQNVESTLKTSMEENTKTENMYSQIEQWLELRSWEKFDM